MVEKCKTVARVLRLTAGIPLGRHLGLDPLPLPNCTILWVGWQVDSRIHSENLQLEKVTETFLARETLLPSVWTPKRNWEGHAAKNVFVVPWCVSINVSSKGDVKMAILRQTTEFAKIEVTNCQQNFYERIHRCHLRHGQLWHLGAYVTYECHPFLGVFVKPSFVCSGTEAFPDVYNLMVPNTGWFADLGPGKKGICIRKIYVWVLSCSSCRTVRNWPTSQGTSRIKNGSAFHG